MRNGSQNFVRAPRSNLIVIQTVDEEKSAEPKRPEAVSSQEKITLIRPQDKWAPTSDVKAASPAKPKGNLCYLVFFCTHINMETSYY